MLREGFVGNCPSFFPQYFTNAMLDGLSHSALISEGQGEDAIPDWKIDNRD
jgi:hypothetical protein